MKKLAILLLFIFFILGISLVQINFVSAKAVDTNNDGKISFGEWVTGIFKSTGDTITGSSSRSGSDEDSREFDSSKSSDSDREIEKSGDSIDSSGSKTSIDLEGSVGDSSGSSSEIEERSTTIDENGVEVEIKTKTNEEEGKTETEEKSSYIDENGNKITIITETKTKNGETETVVKRKIETPDGIEITFKTKTEIEEGKERTTNSIQVEGATVETELLVREEIIDGIPRLKAELSTGAEQEIIILPDKALQTAFEELQATNNFVFEINEIVKEDGTREAVFSAKATKPGKFLGIFNTQVNLETLIDTQTGEIVSTNRPWWAFLVVGQDKANVCHIAEEDLNKVRTLDISITAVKAHLAHGDSLGECVAVCGDSIILEGVEICDDGNTLTGDGCDSLCQIEIPLLNINQTNVTNINKTTAVNITNQTNSTI